MLEMFGLFVLLLVLLFILLQSAQFAIKYSLKVSSSLNISVFFVSFFFVAIISALPETAVSIISAIEGMPELGMSILLSSNIADLTLVFGIVALFSTSGIKVKSEILKFDFLYILMLTLPIVWGLDGSYSRLDGLIFIVFGVLFFLVSFFSYNHSNKIKSEMSIRKTMLYLLLLIAAIVVLAVSAHFVVLISTELAIKLFIPTIIIGVVVISIGTCLPELIYSIKSVRNMHGELAVGDILGTVICDSTIVLGIITLINPFSFNPTIIYINGLGMLFAGLIAILFMRSGKIITKKEGLVLIGIYIVFLITSFIFLK